MDKDTIMDKETNYTIIELFQMLKEDASWEHDQQKREELADAFYASIEFL